MNQRVGLFDINNDKEINKEYIFYLLNSENFEDQMINNAQGAAQPNISKYDVENFIIPLYNIYDQNKIVKMLEDYDKKLLKEQLIIKTFKQLKSVLLNKMFI